MCYMYNSPARCNTALLSVGAVACVLLCCFAVSWSTCISVTPLHALVRLCKECA